jgi:GNAT superfamily N-acetyltransferase
MVVLPGEQGKGIGKALARQVTRLADEEGKRCCTYTSPLSFKNPVLISLHPPDLESSRDVPNIKIYEALGFHFVKQMDCGDGGDVCKLYCMVREPQPLE